MKNEAVNSNSNQNEVFKISREILSSLLLEEIKGCIILHKNERLTEIAHILSILIQSKTISLHTYKGLLNQIISSTCLDTMD